MNNEYLVSIIISNYNYGHFLKDAVDSALDQTYDPVEVIVVDDGSTDNSREIIKKYEDKIKPIFNEHKGLISSWNMGYLKSQGDILCFLDADDIYFSNKIQFVVDKFKEYPQIGWCFHYLKDTDCFGNLIANGKKETNYEGIVDLRDDIKKGHTRYPYVPPPTSGLSFRREIMSNIFPIPENIVDPYDEFIQLSGLCLSPGYHTTQKLAVRRFHEENISIKREQLMPYETEINGIQVAYYLRTRFPETKKFSDKLFARSLGRLWVRERKRLKEIPELKQYITRYYSVSKWITHSLRMMVNIGRVLFHQLKRKI